MIGTVKARVIADRYGHKSIVRGKGGQVNNRLGEYEPIKQEVVASNMDEKSWQTGHHGLVRDSGMDIREESCQKGACQTGIAQVADRAIWADRFTWMADLPS
jgi:hypothetical protein